MEANLPVSELRTLADIVDQQVNPRVILKEIQKRLDEAIEQHKRELSRMVKKAKPANRKTW